MGDKTFQGIRDTLAKDQSDLSIAEAEVEVAARKVACLKKRVEALSSYLAIAEATETMLEASEFGSISDGVLLKNVGQETVDKTAIVRRLAKEMGEQGITPVDVKQAFREAGVDSHPNYSFSVLSRLKAKGDLREEGGRYFAVPKQLDFGA